MSVLVFARVPVKVGEFQRVVDANADALRGIRDEARANGALHHCFVEDEDGNTVIVDEWETAEAFGTFFAEQTEIAKLMADAGVSGPPAVTTYRVIESADKF